MQTFPLKPRIIDSALTILPTEFGLVTNSPGQLLRDPQNISDYSFPNSNTSRVDLPAKQAVYKSSPPLPMFCGTDGSKGGPK